MSRPDGISLRISPFTAYMKRDWRRYENSSALRVCRVDAPCGHRDRGPDWVKVDIVGGHNYTVKHLPPGSADYRSIAIDIHGASIAGGLEPKAALPVDFGLVGQVRVRQIGSMVRVYIDVINWPDYQVMQGGSGVTVALRAFQQRRSEPDAMY